MDSSYSCENKFYGSPKHCTTNTFIYLLTVKQETVNPGCLLPKNFSGEWMNTAHMEADVFINQTHIIETTYPDEGRYRRTIYVCREQRDNRYMMARLNIDGWWV